MVPLETVFRSEWDSSPFIDKSISIQFEKPMSVETIKALETQRAVAQLPLFLSLWSVYVWGIYVCFTSWHDGSREQEFYIETVWPCSDLLNMTRTDEHYKYLQYLHWKKETRRNSSLFIKQCFDKIRLKQANARCEEVIHKNLSIKTSN